MAEEEGEVGEVGSAVRTTVSPKGSASDPMEAVSESVDLWHFQ